MKLFYYDSLLEKIKENVNLNEELYCVSNQININNSFLSIQDKQGSMLQGKKAKLTNRTFSITGTIEASKIEDVEKRIKEHMSQNGLFKIYGKPRI